MRFYFAYFLFFMSCFAFGQRQVKIDSLKNLLLSSINNEEKAELLLSLSKITQNTDIAYSEQTAKEALDLGNLNKNIDIQSQSYFQLAYLNYKEQKDSEAILYFNKLDSIIKQGNTINEVYIKSKLYRAQIAKFTFSIEGLKRGKVYLKEMLELSVAIDNPKYEHLAYYQFGDWYTTFSEVENKMENIDTARIYFDKALKYFTKTNDAENLSKIYQDLSALETNMRRYDEAETYLLKKLNLMKTENDSIEIAKSHYLLGRFYRQTSRYEKAILSLNKAKIIFKTTGFPNNDYRQKFYTNSALAYKGMNDLENAYDYLIKSYALKDTI